MQLKYYENTNMFFVVKYCIKHVGLAKNVVFLINNCLGALSIWLLSSIRLLSVNHFPDRSGRLLSGILENGIQHIPQHWMFIFVTTLQENVFFNFQLNAKNKVQSKFNLNRISEQNL